MTLLVTGASGFVGAHLVAALGRAFPGETIAAADLTAPDPVALAFWARAGVDAPWHRLDVTDRAAVVTLMEALAPRVVIHAAAVTPTPDQERANPAGVLDINLGGTIHVVDAATARPGLERLVVVSSSAVYGNRADLPDPIAEDVEARPSGLYGIAKLAGEAIARRFGALRGVSTVAVRVAAAFGALERPSAHRIGMSQVYPLFAALAAGRTVRAAPNAAVRDWVHADDVGEAIAALVAAPRLGHGVYNVSSGVGLSWRATLDLFAQGGLTVLPPGPDAPPDVAFDPALGRPPLSIARLTADTGFRPRRSIATEIARITRKEPP